MSFNTALASAATFFESLENSENASCGSGGLEIKDIVRECIVLMAMFVTMRTSGLVMKAGKKSLYVKPEQGLVRSRMKSPIFFD